MPVASAEPVMQDSLESLQLAIGANSVKATQMRIEDMADSTALNPVWDAEPDKRIVLTMVRGTEIIRHGKISKRLFIWPFYLADHFVFAVAFLASEVCLETNLEGCKRS